MDRCCVTFLQMFIKGGVVITVEYYQSTLVSAVYFMVGTFATKYPYQWAIVKA